MLKRIAATQFPALNTESRIVNTQQPNNQPQMSPLTQFVYAKMASQVDFVGDMDMVCCEETIGDNNSLLITSHSMLLSNFEDAWLAREWASSRNDDKQDSDNTCSSPTSTKKHSWSVKEKQLFNDGLALYGRKWTKISRFIGTRSVLQVRAYARKQNVKKARVQQTMEVIKLTPNDDFNADEVNVDVIEVEKCVGNEPNEDSCGDCVNPTDKEEFVDICSDNASSASGNLTPEDEEEEENENSLTGNESLLTATIAVPERELVLDQKSVSEDEKRYHHEYFEGKLPKTPDRYVKIRNHILDMWDRTKPSYLNKTAVRLGLKNCGDVNCIGRIHEYLEVRGAINFGCEQACYNRNQDAEVRQIRRKTPKVTQNVDCTLKQSSRLRKRRIFPDRQSIGSNYTIKHTPEGEIIIADSNQEKRNNNNNNNKMARNMNPFKLISCSRYVDKQPFDIHLDLSALIVMDLHAHLSHAEVIGLLGGRYDFEKRLIELRVAEPCLSESTGVQCEMDPVSQTEASVSIEARGLSVVGWYHSHPTFSPNPSVRDLETQAKYQDWFGARGFPFVALILTPYSPNTHVSELRCMLVSDETIFGSYRKPFQLLLSPKQNAFELESCLDDLRKVANDINKSSSSIDLNAPYGDQPQLTYLDKILQSVQQHMNDVGVEAAKMADISRRIENSLVEMKK